MPADWAAAKTNAMQAVFESACLADERRFRAIDDVRFLSNIVQSLYHWPESRLRVSVYVARDFDASSGLQSTEGRIVANHTVGRDVQVDLRCRAALVVTFASHHRAGHIDGAN